MRYVIRDSDGNEYTTFREAIGEGLSSSKARGRESNITRRNGGNTRTSISTRSSRPGRAIRLESTDPEEAAWRTAVDAAPWLVGESEPHEEVPPDELYDKLKPFKERVAEDIKEHDDATEDSGG